MNFEEALKEREIKIRFPDLVRRNIKLQFLQKVIASETISRDDEAEYFIICLEKVAESIQSYKDAEPPKHQTSKEKLNSIAQHLNTFADLLKGLDSAVLGHFVHCALLEREKRTGVSLPELGQSEMMYTARDMREDILPMIKDFGLGSQIASKTLPINDFNFKEKIALHVERIFYEAELEFSVTDNGFSGLCLNSVFEYGNPSDKKPTIKYLLKKAKDSEGSMSSLIKKHRATSDADGKI